MAAHCHVDPIEQLGPLAKRHPCHGVYPATFADPRAAVQEVPARADATHAEALASPMTLNVQAFDDVSRLAA